MFRWGRGALSDPSLSPCATKGPFENAAVPCSREDSMDKKGWRGLLALGEGTAFHQAERRTRRDLQAPTPPGSPLEIGLTIAWSVERPSA